MHSPFFKTPGWQAIAFLLFTIARDLSMQAADPQASNINSLGMKMVLIHPGSFQMGGSVGETKLPSDQWDEGPTHSVTISESFYISATEVTNAQYEQFDPDHRRWRGLRDVSLKDDEAVTYVSWKEAMGFCKWLAKKEGRPYRLPTEAEWEYACRAGTETPYWTGQQLPHSHHRNQWTETDDKRVNQKDKALRDLKGEREIALRVGTMPPNPWGLTEMHGNVEEWVLDWYGPYAGGSRTDPVGPSDGLFKVTRGGSHNTALKYLRSANRSATVPDDKHWQIGFRVVQASPIDTTRFDLSQAASMSDPAVDPGIAKWSEPQEKPVFHGPIPLVRPDEYHPLLSELPHHHNPTITWCENGDLLAAWFNTISEIGREAVIISSRLPRKDGAWAQQWKPARIFFAPADRNATGTSIIHDGKGRLYLFNAIADSGHHRDQSMIMSLSEDSGRSWTRPRIISSLFDRHKYTPMPSAIIEDDGNTIVLAMDYAPNGFQANEAGSGVFISRNGGKTWIDRISGKSAPEVAEGRTDNLAAGFHINIVRLKDDRLLAMARNQGGSDIDGNITMSYSSDEGETWTYRKSPFPDIGSGQRLVLMRLREGPLLFVSYQDDYIFASLSHDEAKTWTPPKPVYNETYGYLAATQTPDGLIHLVTSREYFRFNYPWLISGSLPADAAPRD